MDYGITLGGLQFYFDMLDNNQGNPEKLDAIAREITRMFLFAEEWELDIDQLVEDLGITWECFDFYRFYWGRVEKLY